MLARGNATYVDRWTDSPLPVLSVCDARVYEERPAKFISTRTFHVFISVNLPLTLLHLRLGDMSQLIHLRRLAGNDALGQFNRTSNDILAANSIMSLRRRHRNQTNTRVLGSTIMRAVAEVAEPSLQRRGIVLLDTGAIRLDLGFAGDGRPLAAGVQKAQVDLRVGLEVVGFTGFGVGVEDEVETVAFL